MVLVLRRNGGLLAPEADDLRGVGLIERRLVVEVDWGGREDDGGVKDFLVVPVDIV